MISVVCILIPPLIAVLIRNRIFQKPKRPWLILRQYLAYIFGINGLILLLLLAFFTNGNHLIYNLNHQPIFAAKYISLALVFAVAGPLAEKGLRSGQISKPIKVITFLLICAVIFRGLNEISQPNWGFYEYNPTHGIYDEPKNTIETLFIGTSHVRSGISPMELYEKYGICAYDMSTSGQPTGASYFWLEEVYRLHPETLDTVVYDVSSLRTDPDIANFHKAIDPIA